MLLQALRRLMPMLILASSLGLIPEAHAGGKTSWPDVADLYNGLADVLLPGRIKYTLYRPEWDKEGYTVKITRFCCGRPSVFVDKKNGRLDVTERQGDSNAVLKQQVKLFLRADKTPIMVISVRTNQALARISGAEGAIGSVAVIDPLSDRPTLTSDVLPKLRLEDFFTPDCIRAMDWRTAELSGRFTYILPREGDVVEVWSGLLSDYNYTDGVKAIPQMPKGCPGAVGRRLVWDEEKGRFNVSAARATPSEMGIPRVGW